MPCAFPLHLHFCPFLTERGRKSKTGKAKVPARPQAMCGRAALCVWEQVCTCTCTPAAGRGPATQVSLLTPHQGVWWAPVFAFAQLCRPVQVSYAPGFTAGCLRPPLAGLSRWWAPQASPPPSRALSLSQGSAPDQAMWLGSSYHRTLPRAQCPCWPWRGEACWQEGREMRWLEPFPLFGLLWPSVKTCRQFLSSRLLNRPVHCLEAWDHWECLHSPNGYSLVSQRPVQVNRFPKIFAGPSQKGPKKWSGCRACVLSSLECGQPEFC